MTTLADLAQGYLDGQRQRDERIRRPRTPVLVGLARLAGRLPRWRRIRSGALQLAGLGSLDFAIWDQWGRVAGVAAVGLSLFVLEYLTTPPEERRR